MTFVEMRSAELERALSQLAREARVDFGKVVKEEGRYVTQSLIRYTPPDKRAQGVAAIGADMRRLSTPFPQAQYFESRKTEGGFYPSMAKYVRRRQTEKLQQLLKNPNFRSFSQEFYGKQILGSYAELEGHHLALRTRTGRIATRMPYASYAIDYSKLRREIEKRIGWTAAGWVHAAQVTGAKYRKWINRFGGFKAGVAYYNFSKNPFITARNFNVKIPMYERFVNQTLRSRIKTTELKLKRVLAGKAVNLGFIKVRGNGPIPEPQMPALRQSA
jgi:hypothetical protein